SGSVLQRDIGEMALIERRRSPLCAEVQPVLGRLLAGTRAERGGVVDRLRIRIENRSRKAVMQSAAQLHAAFLAFGIASRGVIGKTRWAVGAWIQTRIGVGVGHESLR